MYRDGELICPHLPGCQTYTHPQLISNLNHNKIKRQIHDKTKALEVGLNPVRQNIDYIAAALSTML